MLNLKDSIRGNKKKNYNNDRSENTKNKINQRVPSNISLILIHTKLILFEMSYILKITTTKNHYFFLNVSPCDNKSASHWIMFDYFFHVRKVTIFSY